MNTTLNRLLPAGQTQGCVFVLQSCALLILKYFFQFRKQFSSLVPPQASDSCAQFGAIGRDCTHMWFLLPSCDVLCTFQIHDFSMQRIQKSKEALASRFLVLYKLCPFSRCAFLTERFKKKVSAVLNPSPFPATHVYSVSRVSLFTVFIFTQFHRAQNQSFSTRPREKRTVMLYKKANSLRSPSVSRQGTPSRHPLYLSTMAFYTWMAPCVIRLDYYRMSTRSQVQITEVRFVFS